MDLIFIPYHAPQMEDIQLDVVVGDGVYPRQLKATKLFLPNGNMIHIHLPKDADNVPTTSDQLNSSSYGFLRIMVDVAMLDDVIHSGDILVDRLIICLKKTYSIMCWPTLISIKIFLPDDKLLDKSRICPFSQAECGREAAARMR